MILAIGCVVLVALGLGLALRRVAPAPADRSLIEQIDALLPQTQCGQCRYAGCRPYAEAIASGEADINQCPPGGAAGIRALATLLQRPEKPLNPDHGAETPRVVALIDEAVCIGCTKCIQVCPVDAILGAPQLMHSVLTAECTGCGLCLPPCPVDCISLPLAEDPANRRRLPRPAIGAIHHSAAPAARSA